MLFEIIFLYHWLFAKVCEKTSPKDLQKQPKWCKCGPNVKIRESNHIYLKILKVGLNSK